LIKTIFKNFPDIYTHLGTNLYYIPIVISKSAHPTVHGTIFINFFLKPVATVYLTVLC
jgi:hypothetical protein